MARKDQTAEAEVTTEASEGPVTKTLNILGFSVEISAPYVTGHPITAAEAKVLNQTRKENIGNNVRTKVKEIGENPELSDDDKDLAVLALIAEVDSTYEFTMSNAGSTRPSADPFERMCISIAKDAVSAKIKAAGFRSVKAYKEEKGDAKYDSLIETASSNPAVQAIARKRLEEQAALNDVEI